jgi:hypothetical protein
VSYVYRPPLATPMVRRAPDDRCDGPRSLVGAFFNSLIFHLLLSLVNMAGMLLDVVVMTSSFFCFFALFSILTIACTTVRKSRPSKPHRLGDKVFG